MRHKSSGAQYGNERELKSSLGKNNSHEKENVEVNIRDIGCRVSMPYKIVIMKLGLVNSEHTNRLSAQILK